MELEPEFYTAKHFPGEINVITNSGQQREILKQGPLMGFFLAEHLKKILDQNKKKTDQEKCVGIRFYNAGGLTEKDHRLIAVGLNSKGEEIVLETNGTKYSKSVGDPGLPVEKMGKVEATHAVWEAKRARKKPEDSSRISFASYFSRTMIERLLAPENGVAIAGIRFYMVPQEPFGAGNDLTHIGVPFALVKGKIKQLENAGGELGIVYIRSDLTCPKYCVAPAVPVEQISNARGSAEPGATYVRTTQAIVTNDRYLNVWD